MNVPASFPIAAPGQAARAGNFAFLDSVSCVSNRPADERRSQGFAILRLAPYIPLMLRHSRFNPTAGIADFWNEIRRPHPYRWPILALSVLPVVGILAWALEQEFYGEPERPRITYITTLPDGRSDAEILAENRANQELKDLRAAEEERIAREKREMYKALGAATGIDVETMERKAEAERAAAAAAEAKEREERAARIKAAAQQESAGQ